MGLRESGVSPCLYGAEGGTRTHTTLRPLDFESSASTSSTTSAPEVPRSTISQTRDCVSRVFEVIALRAWRSDDFVVDDGFSDGAGFKIEFHASFFAFGANACLDFR